MNTSGMIRGLLSKNKSVEDFLQTVVKAIGQGFEFDIARSQYIQYCYGNYIDASIRDKETGEDVRVDELLTEFPHQG